jgi:hypothetical protein
MSSTSSDKAKSNNGWNGNFENICCSLSKRVLAYSNIYEKMLFGLQSKSKYINFFITTLSAVLGTSGVYNLFNNGCDFKNCSFAILSFVLLICTSLKSIWKTDENITNLLNAHVGYHNLYKKIIYQLSLKRKERENGKVFVPNIMNELTDLKLTSNIVDEKILEKYEVKHGVLPKLNNTNEQHVGKRHIPLNATNIDNDMMLDDTDDDVDIEKEDEKIQDNVENIDENNTKDIINHDIYIDVTNYDLCNREC